MKKPERLGKHKKLLKEIAEKKAERAQIKENKKLQENFNNNELPKTQDEINMSVSNIGMTKSIILQNNVNTEEDIASQHAEDTLPYLEPDQSEEGWTNTDTAMVVGGVTVAASLGVLAYYLLKPDDNTKAATPKESAKEKNEDTDMRLSKEHNMTMLNTLIDAVNKEKA